MQADPTASEAYRLSALNRITTKLSLTFASFAVGDTLIGPAQRFNQFARPPPGR
jgi:hypothetical protein